MHVSAYISILMLSRYACALEATSKDASSKLISKEGSILSASMNKPGNSTEAGKENSNKTKDKPNSSLEKKMEKQEANPKIVASSLSPSKKDKSTTGLASDLLSSGTKESPTHLIRLSESVQIIRDTQGDITEKPPSIIRDDNSDPVRAEKKSVLSNLATSAIESRDSGDDRKELHEASTNLI